MEQNSAYAGAPTVPVPVLLRPSTTSGPSAFHPPRTSVHNSATTSHPFAAAPLGPITHSSHSNLPLSISGLPVAPMSNNSSITSDSSDPNAAAARLAAMLMQGGAARNLLAGEAANPGLLANFMMMVQMGGAAPSGMSTLGGANGSSAATARGGPATDGYAMPVLNAGYDAPAAPARHSAAVGPTMVPMAPVPVKKSPAVPLYSGQQPALPAVEPASSHYMPQYATGGMLPLVPLGDAMQMLQAFPRAEPAKPPASHRMPITTPLPGGMPSYSGGYMGAAELPSWNNPTMAAPAAARSALIPPVSRNMSANATTSSRSAPALPPQAQQQQQPLPSLPAAQPTQVAAVPAMRSSPPNLLAAAKASAAAAALSPRQQHRPPKSAAQPLPDAVQPLPAAPAAAIAAPALELPALELPALELPALKAPAPAVAAPAPIAAPAPAPVAAPAPVYQEVVPESPLPAGTTIQAVRVSRAPRSLRFIRDSSSADFDLPSMKVEPPPQPPQSDSDPVSDPGAANWLLPRHLDSSTGPSNGPHQQAPLPPPPPPRPLVRVPVPQVVMPAWAPAVTWDLTTSLLLAHTDGPMPVLKPPAACIMDQMALAANTFFTKLSEQEELLRREARPVAVVAASSGPLVGMVGPMSNAPPKPRGPVLAMPDACSAIPRAMSLPSYHRTGSVSADETGGEGGGRRPQRARKRSAAWVEAEEAAAAALAAQGRGGFVGAAVPIPPSRLPKPAGVSNGSRPVPPPPMPPLPASAYRQLAPPPPLTAHQGVPAGISRPAHQPPSYWQGSMDADDEMGSIAMGSRGPRGYAADALLQDLSAPGDDDGGGSDWEAGSGDDGSGDDMDGGGRFGGAKRRRPAYSSAAAGAGAGWDAPQSWGEDQARPAGSPHPAIRHVSLQPESPHVPAVHQQLRQRPTRKRRPSQRSRSSPGDPPGGSSPARAPRPQAATPSVTPQPPPQRVAGRKVARASAVNKPATGPTAAQIAAKAAAAAATAAAVAAAAAAAAAAAKARPRPPPKRATSPCIRFVPPDELCCAREPCGSAACTLNGTPRQRPSNTSTRPSHAQTLDTVPPLDQGLLRSASQQQAPDVALSSQQSAEATKGTANGSPSMTTRSSGSPPPPQAQPAAPEVPCMHPRGVQAPAWRRGADGPLPASAVATESEWAASQDGPLCVVCSSHPDFVPGDKLSSMVAWLRGLSMDLREREWDMGLYHTYQHKYVEALQRARVLEQRAGALCPTDPLACPDNLPGPRPPTLEERRAMRAAQQEGVSLRGEHGYRTRQHLTLPSSSAKAPMHRLMVGARYQATIPPCVSPLPPSPPASPQAPADAVTATATPTEVKEEAGAAAAAAVGPIPAALDLVKASSEEVEAAAAAAAMAARKRRPLSAAEMAMLGEPVISPAMLEAHKATAAAAAGGAGSKRATTRRAATAAAILAEKRRKAARVVYPAHQELCATVGKQLAAAGSLPARHKIMDSTMRDMDEGMKDLVQVLGLVAVGSKARTGWTAADESAFAEGLREHDREFELVQKNFLPHKPMSQIVSYYYNIWKIRYSEDSVAWHEERRQLKAMAAAEEAAEAAAAAEESDSELY